MMANIKLPNPALGSVLAVRQYDSGVERQAAARKALELVADPRCDNPIPVFMLHLPWSTDADEAVDNILAQLLVSDDPERFQSGEDRPDAKNLVGQRITVHDLRVRSSTTDGGWGAYLLLDITIGQSEEHQSLSTSSKQAVVRLARAFSEGDLPASGTFVQLAVPSKGRSAPLGFIVDKPFPE